MHLDLTPDEARLLEVAVDIFISGSPRKMVKHDDGACRGAIHSGDKYPRGELWLCEMFLF